MDIVTSDPQSVGTTADDGSALDSWQKIVQQAIRDPDELKRRLDLPVADDPRIANANQRFSTFVPQPWLERIRPGDPRDPLLLQTLPVAEETRELPGFSADPVGDLPATVAPGLIHKYPGRALVVTNGDCAIHCRYCFRRQFPYQTSPRSEGAFDQVLQTIRGDASIEEVILSGGDPLMMSDRRLAARLDMIGRIAHVRRIRLHTRLPVVIPQRVTPELSGILAESPRPVVAVMHVNHPRELDEAVNTAFRRLTDAGVILLNQTVLLAGINDDVEVLAELSQQLVQFRCLPYYLHQLDRVRGAAHFEVPVARGRELVDQLRGRLPGYAVPRYVCEVAGDPAKRILA